MDRRILVCMGLLLFILAFSQAYADDPLKERIANYCSEPLETVCRDVTPGKGRVLACLYAFSDQVTDPCRDAVIEATEQAKLYQAAADYLKNECGADAQQFCEDVKPGDGRILNCLDEHAGQLSSRCKTALRDVGLAD